jgi:hypothetical protein
MKRLYVRPAFRRFGLGRLLAEALLRRNAQQTGYSTVLLDTLDDMEAARELYVTLGFEEIPPYYFNPIAGAHYLKADLSGWAVSLLTTCLGVKPTVGEALTTWPPGWRWASAWNLERKRESNLMLQLA